jgi:hypothetical protein
MDSGRLVAGFRTGSAKDSADEDVRLMASDDEGATWQPVFEGFGDVPPGAGGRIRCIGLAAAGGDKLMASLSWVDHSNPTLPMFNPQTEGILPTRVLFVESEDGGRSWTEPVEVPLLPHRGNAITGPIMVVRDGRLALPYEAWKEYEDTGPGKHHASLRFSADRGKTWPELAIVAHDPAGRVLYWDQRLAVDPASGRLIAMFWSHDRQAKHDLDVHIAWGAPDGREWSAPQSAGIAGQIAAPLAIGGERVFAGYVHRHYPPSLRALLSDDFGRTWTAAEELVFYEKVYGGGESGMGGQRDFNDYWADMSVWTFGHPAPLLLPNGDVMVVFYAGDETAMSFRWVRIAL